jgi:HSP20 family molecular chaperone IbpA
MAKHDFDPIKTFLQLESDLRLRTAVMPRTLQFHPSLDMFETASALVIKMELAGVQPERLAITLSADDRALTVAGERREAQEEHEDRIRCYHLEIYFGKFEREIALPKEMRFDREHIMANYHDGFLVITLPKRAEKRTIEIRND